MRFFSTVSGYAAHHRLLDSRSAPERRSRVVEGAQIGMRDHSGTAGIVNEDVEPALGRADRGGEVLDGARILRRRAACSVTGAGQARDQPVGGLGVIAESDDDTCPAAANRRAVAAPRPLLPPVTTATRPSSMPMIVIPFAYSAAASSGAPRVFMNSIR